MDRLGYFENSYYVGDYASRIKDPFVAHHRFTFCTHVMLMRMIIIQGVSELDLDKDASWMG